MRKMFDPKTVALIGATESEGSVGRTIMENLIASAGRAVFPVNPKHPTILDLPTFKTHRRSAREDRSRRGRHSGGDRARRASGVRGCRRRRSDRGLGGLRGDRQARARRSSARSRKILADSPMRVVGPNCLGIIRPTVGLNASFLKVNPEAGNIALDLAERGAGHWDARLGGQCADRVLDVRFGGQHGRRRLRGPHRLPRRGLQHAQHPHLHGERGECPAVHECRAKLRPQQADHRPEAGALLRERRGCPVAHGLDGRRRRDLRGRVQTRGCRAGARGRRAVPRRRGARVAPAARWRRHRDRHERRGARGHGDRRPR